MEFTCGGQSFPYVYIYRCAPPPVTTRDDRRELEAGRSEADTELGGSGEAGALSVDECLGERVDVEECAAECGKLSLEH